ncbi:MAG TPA: peptidoglycan-binding domain-containing protein [bacterium]|nr:peptidoglycan-binding domain-containing protein [bacterium]
MKHITKNLMEGISLCHKALLVAIFSLLALSISPGLTMAKTIDADPIDVKPFFQDNGFVVNTKKAPYLGEQYWLEKQEAIEKYEIDLSAGYKTNLKDGLYPLIFKKAPEEDLFQYYQKNSNLRDDYIKDLVNGTEAFAYIKIDGDQARLVSTDSDKDKLVVNYNFPIGNYSISLLSSDHSELANWPCRVVDKYPAADIFAVETVYNTLTLGDSNKIYGNIVLPTPIADNGSVKISWISSKPETITINGTVGTVTRGAEDISVTLRAHIVSDSFSMDKDFNLLVAKKDPYLEKVEFTVNSQRMEHKDNYHFWLQKQNGVKSYRLDFGDYKTNLQDGKYAIRFDDLSSELRESLQKYYDSNSEGLSEEEIQSMINGKESCAYIQVFGGKLSLISARKADIKLSFSTAIIGIDSNPLLISAEYPNGVYNIIADLDGLAGSNKVKWQVEVVPEEVIVDPDIALVEADYNGLSLDKQVTADFTLPTGANGSSISWTSDNTAIVIDGNNAKVTRPDFAAGDAIVDLTATLSKGSVSRTKSFTLRVLKKDQVIIPPTTGGGGGGGGIAGSVVPQSINAINFPLNLIGSQNGVLTQSFANGLSAKLTVVPNSFTGNVTFKIADGPEDNAVGGSHFAITATDSNGNYVRNFANNLNITFSGLTLPDNTAGLGVYYYDEALLSWILVPGAIFNQADGSVSFSVNHLTNFAVFAEQPVTQQVLGQTAYANGTLLRGSDKHIFVVVDGKLQRILNLQELAQYSGQEILQVEDSVIAGYAKVPSKAVLGDRKYNFTRDLKIGSTGDDVQELQKYLNNNGYIVSKTGAGSPGQETKMFGRATRDALIKFQKANNITPAVGYFGPVTRKVVNK